jgi:tetratricopeptide (TPR) repeat protein
VELELDNYRAVLEWALKDGCDTALGGAVAGALSRLWVAGGLAVEGRYWIGQAQASLDESAHPQEAARLWLALAALSDGTRRHDYAQRALALYDALGDGRGAAWALYALAFALLQMGQLEEASDLNARALALMRECADKSGVAACFNQQAGLQRSSGDVAAARELFAQALDAYKALGDEGGMSRTLAGLAELEFGDGQVEQALRLAGEALEIDSRGKNQTGLALGYDNIAAYRIALGDVVGAREAAREALRLARQAERALLTAIALQHFALLGALRGEVRGAAQLIGYVDAQYKELGYKREATEKWCYEKLMAALREQLSDAEIEKLAAEGAARSEDQAVDEALKV